MEEKAAKAAAEKSHRSVDSPSHKLCATVKIERGSLRHRAVFYFLLHSHAAIIFGVGNGDVGVVYGQGAAAAAAAGLCGGECGRGGGGYIMKRLFGIFGAYSLRQVNYLVCVRVGGCGLC